MTDYPTVYKTWQYNVNQVFNSTGNTTTDCQNLLLGIVNSFIGFSSNPWTVVGSSNSTVAALDGVNRWITNSNLVWNSSSSAHSWIVLKQAGISSNFQLLISCGTSSGTSAYKLNVSISRSAGFTGGSTTADPTATDSISIISNSNWGGPSSSSYNLKLHVEMSSDGQCTRWQVLGGVTGSTNSPNSNNLIFALIDVPQNPVSGWNNPFVICWNATSSTGSDLTSALATSAELTGYGVSTMTLYCTGEGVNASLIKEYNQIPNDISSGYYIGSIGLFSNTTSNQGRHGQLFDMWWGTSIFGWTTGSTGRGGNGLMFQGSSSNAYAQIGQILIPWNGSQILFNG